MKELWSLPANWRWAEFSEVARVDSNLVDPAHYSQLPHIAPNHIESGTGRLLEYTTVEKDGVTSGKHLFHAGHILYSKIRPYLAKVVVVDFAGLCSADMYPVSTDLETSYLHRWLVSPMFTEQAARNQGRTVLPKINQDALARLPVPVAPPNEQRRIVAKLEALQARSRRAREALDAVPSLLEKLRQSILAAAFRGDLTKDWRAKHKDVEPASELLKRIRGERRKKWEEGELAKMRAKGKAPADDRWKEKYRKPEAVDPTGLPELPDGWCWAGIGELADVGTGATPKRGEERFYSGGTIPWVTSGALNDEFVREAREFVTDRAVMDTNLTIYPPGTLLLAMYGEGKTRGMVAELTIEAATNQAIAAICLEGSALVAKSLIRLALAQNYAKIRSISMGGVQPNLNLEKVRSLVIPLCPAAEAPSLDDAVTAALARVSALFALVCEQSKAVDVLDRALLTKAFRGELVPQDPNDEPAETMLAGSRASNEGSVKAAENILQRRSGRTKQRSEGVS